MHLKKSERAMPLKLSETRMNFPIKLLSLLFLAALINGCAFIPAPLIYMNNIKTVYDTVSFLNDSPTSNDMVLSSVTGKNCRVSNMIDDLDVCSEKSSTDKMKDYVDQYYYVASNDIGITW
jgi:hypothetical protein